MSLTRHRPPDVVALDERRNVVLAPRSDRAGLADRHMKGEAGASIVVKAA